MTAIKLALSVAAFWTVAYAVVGYFTGTWNAPCAVGFAAFVFGSSLLVLGLCNAAARQDHTIDT